MEVYIGKQQLSNKSEDVVTRLSSKLRSGHVICGDNYFTSLNLNNLLFQKGVFYFGKLRKIRREVPKTMINIKGLTEYSSKFLFNKDNAMVSYIPRKNRNVLL